jgi:hypothetical protein
VRLRLWYLGPPCTREVHTTCTTAEVTRRVLVTSCTRAIICVLTFHVNHHTLHAGTVCLWTRRTRLHCCRIAGTCAWRPPSYCWARPYTSTTQQARSDRRTSVARQKLHVSLRLRRSLSNGFGFGFWILVTDTDLSVSNVVRVAGKLRVGPRAFWHVGFFEVA